MKTTGIIFSRSEIEELNDRGYLTELQLLDDNGGEPYGNCVIVAESSFSAHEIDELDIADRVVEVFYTQDFDDSMAETDFEGQWWAKGCTGEAFFELESDYDLLFV